MNFSKAIITTEYFPPITTFWAALNSDTTLIEACENYQKKSTRNRTKILGVNGIELLTVPLQKGKNNKMPIQEVKIAYGDHWQSKHLQSIKSAYGNAPYFEFYYAEIANILRQDFETLYQLNQHLFDFINGTLNLEIEVQRTNVYQKEYDEKDIDLRNFKIDKIESRGYDVKSYNQVFEEKHGFISGLSILDLLMCKGPESILYI